MSTTPWRPSRPVAYLLGLLSIWPPIYFVFFIGFMGYLFVARANHGFGAFGYIFVFHLGTMLLGFALTAVYLIHAFRNDQLAQDRRILWVIVLLLFGFFADPVYWWLYVRPRETLVT
ncbi:MAG TPA: hypothetical protein VGJ82_06950 [Thermoanaerobaculia bacterium]|jgi:uncharacterized membrane protein (DUF485 family)